jgi:hypothetical protein
MHRSPRSTAPATHVPCYEVRLGSYRPVYYARPRALGSLLLSSQRSPKPPPGRRAVLLLGSGPIRPRLSSHSAGFVCYAVTEELLRILLLALLGSRCSAAHHSNLLLPLTTATLLLMATVLLLPLRWFVPTVVSAVVVLLAFAPVQSAAAVVCTGGGDSTRDWLVNGCPKDSTFSSSTAPDGSVVYSLSNGIVTRELTYNTTSKVLSTTAVKMTANQTARNLVRTVVPEASFTVNGVPVQVGGLAGQIAGARMALFSTVRSGLSAVAGGYTWVAGVRGSNPNAAWPPQGSRTEFVHELSCRAMGAAAASSSGGGSDGEWITVTVSYEQYKGTSGFSRSVAVAHNCSKVHTCLHGFVA